MHPDDVAKDAHTERAPGITLSLEERAARALASGKLNEWEEGFTRSKLAQIRDGRELTAAQLDKLQDILDTLGDVRPDQQVNVPSAAEQFAKLKADLAHDEAVLQERIEADAYVPLDLAARCERRRQRLGLDVPAWLHELGERHRASTVQPQRMKLTAREVEKRLKRLATQGGNAEDGEAVA